MSTATFWSKSCKLHHEPAPCCVHEPQHLCAHKPSLLLGPNFLLPLVPLFKKRFYVSHLS